MGGSGKSKRASSRGGSDLRCASRSDAKPAQRKKKCSWPAEVEAGFIKIYANNELGKDKKMSKKGEELLHMAKMLNQQIKNGDIPWSPKDSEPWEYSVNEVKNKILNLKQFARIFWNKLHNEIKNAQSGKAVDREQMRQAVLHPGEKTSKWTHAEL